MIKGKFIDNLPKVYGIYTGGFLAFIILMAVLEQAGVSAKAIGISFVVFTIAIYAIIGWLSRTLQVDAYSVEYSRNLSSCYVICIYLKCT